MIANCCISNVPVKSIIFLATICSLFPLHLLLTLSNSGNCCAEPLSHQIHILAISFFSQCSSGVYALISLLLLESYARNITFDSYTVKNLCHSLVADQLESSVIWLSTSFNRLESWFSFWLGHSLGFRCIKRLSLSKLLKLFKSVRWLRIHIKLR